MLLLLLIAECLVSASLAEYNYYSGYRLYRLLPAPYQMRYLERFRNDPDFDFWSGSPGNGRSVDIMVSPRRINEMEAILRRLSIKYRVLIPDVQLKMMGTRRSLMGYTDSGNSTISFNRYNRYNEIIEYLRQLAIGYPHRVSVCSIGKSFEGRDIGIAKISSGGSGTRPVILIDAGIHAREWIAPAMALYIINQLVENEANSDLISKVDWHIIPVLNVDGYEYTHTKDRLWRKTRSWIPGERCIGVDANRNFGFHWMDGDSSSDPCSPVYPGRHPFSEAETIAFRDHALGIMGRTKMYITFHSYGNYILYPWGYTNALPADFKSLEEVARVANKAQRDAGGEDYTIGSSSKVLYNAPGGSDDWMKGVAKVNFSYTVELPGFGEDAFHLPEPLISSTVREFFEAVRILGLFTATYFS